MSSKALKKWWWIW